MLITFVFGTTGVLAAVKGAQKNVVAAKSTPVAKNATPTKSIEMPNPLIAKPITERGKMRIGLGVYDNYAAVRFIGETYTSTIGLRFINTSANNNNTTNFSLLGQWAYNVTGGIVPTHLGGRLGYDTNAGVSTLSVGVVYGAEVIIADHFNVGLDVIPLEFLSQSNNVSQFRIGLASIYAAYLF